MLCPVHLRHIRPESGARGACRAPPLPSLPRLSGSDRCQDRPVHADSSRVVAYSPQVARCFYRRSILRHWTQYSRWRSRAWSVRRLPAPPLQHPASSVVVCSKKFQNRSKGVAGRRKPAGGWGSGRGPLQNGGTPAAVVKSTDEPDPPRNSAGRAGGAQGVAQSWRAHWPGANCDRAWPRRIHTHSRTWASGFARAWCEAAAVHASVGGPANLVEGLRALHTVSRRIYAFMLRALSAKNC